MKYVLAVILCFFAAFPAAAAPRPAPPSTQQALFAGGCFWCLHSELSGVNGVLSVTSGYTGGTVPKPTYEQVASGKTGHVEAVLVIFNPTRVSYDKLLDIYWSNIDPMDNGGQFNDRGSQYRTVIYTFDDEQKEKALVSKKAVEQKLKKPIVTQILPAGEFYAAEDYHQDYAKKNPFRYNAYKMGSGRSSRLKEVWGN